MLGLGAQHASVLGAAPDDGVVHALLDRVFLALFGEGALHPLNILLGEADPRDCIALDVDGNLTVTVDELVRAVNGALEGCPAS